MILNALDLKKIPYFMSYIFKVQKMWKISRNLKFLYVNVSRQPSFLDSILYYCNHFKKWVALGGKKFNI